MRGTRNGQTRDLSLSNLDNWQAALPVRMGKGLSLAKRLARGKGPTSDQKFKSGKGAQEACPWRGSDPYWTPCDYSTAWGPNACGGFLRETRGCDRGPN